MNIEKSLNNIDEGIFNASEIVNNFSKFKTELDEKTVLAGISKILLQTESHLVALMKDMQISQAEFQNRRNNDDWDKPMSVQQT